MTSIELFEEHGTLFAIERDGDLAATVNLCPTDEPATLADELGPDDPDEPCSACGYANVADYLHCACCGESWRACEDGPPR
jgi:hypothetical protein